MQRPIQHWAAIVMVCTLSACASTDTPEGYTRVETWETRSQTVGDGPTQTTNTHTVGLQKDPEKGPEWAFKGIWHIQDYTAADNGNRHCYVELFPAKLGRYNFLARGTKECAPDMNVVAAWRPTGDPKGNVVILVDKTGTTVGEFDKVSENLFRGVFTLTSGEVVKAHFKAW